MKARGVYAYQGRKPQEPDPTADTMAAEFQYLGKPSEKAPPLYIIFHLVILLL